MYPVVYRINVEGQHVKRLHEDRALDQHRLARLNAADLVRNPILFGHMPDGTQLLIDGRHRYARAHALGWRFIKAHILKPEEWEPFRVAPPPGLEKFSAEEIKQALRNSPSGL